MNNRGFTLVEIVIAMTILALISGTVMAILVQAGDTAAEIRDMDQKDEEISRYLHLLERTIETLPVDASVEMVNESESVSGFTEMKISNAVGAFTFGEDIGSAGELIIGLQPQPENEEYPEGEFYQLAISRDSFAPEDTDGSGMVFGAGGDDFLTADSEGRYWLPLVEGIVSVTWRYWDEDGSEWLEDWDEDTLPPLMEYIVEDSHRPGPVRVVFEIPEHLVTGETAASSGAQTTSPQSNTLTVPSTGGRGAGGGNRGSRGRGQQPRPASPPSNPDEPRQPQ